MQVARALRESVSALELVAEEGDQYGNAIAIVAIHGAIAYADALSITYGGFKSTAGDHEKAADALEAALGRRADPAALHGLLKVLKQKDTASYQGVYFTLQEARALAADFQEFARWAEELFEQRPAGA